MNFDERAENRLFIISNRNPKSRMERLADTGLERIESVTAAHKRMCASVADRWEGLTRYMNNIDDNDREHNYLMREQERLRLEQERYRFEKRKQEDAREAKERQERELKYQKQEEEQKEQEIKRKKRKQELREKKRNAPLLFRILEAFS